jgi:protein-S-isoprenylcysteine O-methyltransferase Ste14
MRRWTPVLTIGLAACMMWLEQTIRARGIWDTRHRIGLGVVLCSLPLWAVARYQLGASFTGRAEARRLVTHGLYARIRHPIYVFGEIASFGMLLFVGAWVLMPSLLITIPMQAWRARKEARVLEAAFGAEYVAYRRKTWF